VNSLTTPSVLFENVNKAFSKQSHQYDTEDASNIILRDLRKQVYAHASQFVKNGNRILELNAGTGIDALHFINQGCKVYATDLSDGMIAKINEKITANDLSHKLFCQQVSYEQLNQVKEKNFDFAFSNFGGLNCSSDLNKITRHLPALLKPQAFVTFVIMPRVCPWEMLQILKLNPRAAFRRFTRNGVMAHLEGEYFKTFYFSLAEIKKAFGRSFTFIQSEGLAALSPPPHRGDLPVKNPGLYNLLRKADAAVKDSFPFNRWADHLIVTFQFNP